MSLNKYQCHKVVEGGKITSIIGSTLIMNGGRVTVDQGYMLKHVPKVGGYYVKYEGGYESWSPATEFEEGYELLD